MAENYDRRRANYMGHQDMNALARQELQRRGVTDPRGLPTQDVRTSSSDAYMNSDAPRFERAVPAAPEVSPQLEAQARAAGFPSYEAMMHYMKRRQEKTGGTIPQEQRSQAPAAEQAMSWHPAAILDYVSNMYRRATGD
jgi:hypothetical protein